MPQKLKKLVFFMLLSTLCLGVYATHIVGGDFYYSKVSSNQYKVTLKLYVDCENGNPQAIQSDVTAIVALWNAGTGNLIRLENFNRTSPTRLNKLYYKCLIPPTDVCVDEYVYTKTLTIDPGADGVILAFQRCCRNNTITNIIKPESTGATYWVKIPGTDLVSYNNSAVFKELPPNYLCTDAPLKFDHSAVDPDGDSLVYELYQPYLGATTDEPRPDNGANGSLQRPPFNNLIWKTPYSTYNQMGGNPILEINSRTGELTLTPTTVGQFVIGIKVKEYRNGVLIGETLRDYQMNVKKCNFDLIAAFAAPTYSCSDTVKFTNRSYKATNYKWNFGDPTTTDDTSSSANPTYVYPKDGDYEVSLYAWNSICSDEYKFTVRVRANIVLDLGPNIYFCDDKKINVYLTAPIWDATKVFWSNGKYGNSIVVKDTGKYVATVYYGTCTASDSIYLINDSVDFYIPPDVLFCYTDKVDCVIDVGVPGLKYRWSPSPADTFQKLNIKDTGVYWVRVRNEHCQKVDSVRIFLSTPPKIPSDFFICNVFTKEIDAGDIPEATYRWSNGSTGRYNVINSAGIHWVEVTQRQCVSRDTLIVTNPIIDLDLGLDTNYCDSLFRVLSAPPDMLSYLWQDGSTEQTFSTNAPGKYYVFVADTNGCTLSDTINLYRTFSPTVELGPDTSICKRSVVKIGPPKDYFAYRWSNGSDERFIEVSDSGFYYLTVIDEAGCSGNDSIKINVDVNALPNELFIPNSFTPNGDGLNETFPFSELIQQPEYRVRVFNRWGQKVFDSNTDESQWWNATFKDQQVESTAYVFMIDYRACDGRNRHVNGTVTPLR